MSGRQLRALLAERFPEHHAAALAYACRCHLPLVQVPPRAVWGKTMQVVSTPLPAWTGLALDPSPSIDDLVLRYLAAFGPATVADAAAWTRLTGFAGGVRPAPAAAADVPRRAGPRAFDLPDAPRPDADVPAPVRVLPQYDNALLSHKDRRRFGPGVLGAFAQARRPFRGRSSSTARPARSGTAKPTATAAR